MTFPPFIERFLRGAVSIVIGNVMASLVTYVGGFDWGADNVMIGTAVGLGVQSLDKFLRDKGVYGGSLERLG